MPGLSFTNPLLLLLLPALLGWAAWVWLGDRGSLSLTRHRLALGLRLVIMGALVLVLAGATLQQPATRQATIFVADLSASTAGERDAETAFIARALAARGHDDIAGVVAVGGDALVEQSPGHLDSFAGFQSIVDPTSTNLEAGLNLAGALFPAGYRKRVVLLTDGQQNVGDAASAAQLLRDEGARLDVVPMAPRAGPEALVTGADAPADAASRARIPLTVSLHSTVAQRAGLDVFDGTRPLTHESLSLPAGDSQVSLSLPPPGPGFHRLHVVLTPTRDTVPQNNVGDALTRVRGAPRVLLAEGAPGEGNAVAGALRAQGMTVQQVEASQVEPSTAYLSRFDAVVLVDVPAIALDPLLIDPNQSPLRSYVNGGGGLVIIGGPNSFGVGGYTGTALDTLSPVAMTLPRRRDTPSVAVALIIEDLESQSNVNISKAAGEGVIKLLTPLDQVEVNDASDNPSDPGWAVPLQYDTNQNAIVGAIDHMTPYDPISYKQALTSAYNTLLHAHAAIKHIILLGDGDAEDAYQALVTRIRRSGITVSTVATGAGQGGLPADYATMQDIARWGGGRYYAADNPAAIPSIFVRETKQVARTGIVEERFAPQVATNSPILTGVPALTLGGYVATSPKAAGTQVLVHVTHHGIDPVLAQWQYGLGHVVAWTSDAAGRWTNRLLGSRVANRLWANMVSWTLAAPSSNRLVLLPPRIAGSSAHLTVLTSGLPLDASVSAQVAGPRGAATTVALAATAPGQYEADVPLAGTGAYLLGIRASVGGRVSATLLTGMVAPYPAEYRATGLNSPLLNTIASIGGGVILRAPSASFANNLPPVDAALPLSDSLLLLALLLLPVDVAVRRLAMGPREALAALSGVLGRRALQPASASSAPSAPLMTLRADRATRRERLTARQSQKVQADAAQARRPGGPPTEPGPVEARQPTPSRGAKPVGGAGLAAPNTATSQDSATARLLAAKRRRREK